MVPSLYIVIVSHLSIVSKRYGSIKDCLVANFDLLHEGRTLLSRLRSTTTVTLSWVKGHYSGDKKSIPHILNEAAHDLANEFLHKDQGYFKPIREVIDPHHWRSLFYTTIQLLHRTCQ